MRWMWLLCSLGFTWADLRPREVRGNVETGPRTERCRDTLERIESAYGKPAFAARTTMSVVGVDRWEARKQSPWSTDEQRFSVDRVTGTFTSKLTMLDGPDAGTTLGLQDWQGYKDGEADSGFLTRFYLPALHYFDELPFRLSSGTVCLHAGRSDDGFERLFVSWGDAKAHAEHDQYLLYVDSQTHQIDRVAYTIREAVAEAPWVLRGVMKAAAVGTIHFREVRVVDGVSVPFRSIVVLGDGEPKRRSFEDRVFHVIELQDVSFDKVPLERVLSSAGQVGSDRKP